jgi:hypothetical protein
VELVDEVEVVEHGDAQGDVEGRSSIMNGGVSSIS